MSCTRIWMIWVAIIALGQGAASTALGQAKPDPERVKGFTELRRIMREEDSFRAVEHVLTTGDARKVAMRFFHFSMDFYHQAKNLRASMVMGRAGIQFCLMKAKEIEGSDAKLSKGLRGLAQNFAFNMASFAWPGWDEKGIEISRDQMAFGLDMAKLDLRLVTELKLGARKLSVAHWIVGAQLLAHRKYVEARKSFETAKAKAKEARDEDGEWMNHGYLAIVEIVRGKDPTKGIKLLDEALTMLKERDNDDAEFYAKQLEDVLKVFQR
ncbi:MAG: hypothetical protein ACYTFG_11795 [Planctomycetota bacterium]